MTHETARALDVYLHGIIGVDYVLHLSTTLAASSTRFTIEREERAFGALMGRCARLLQERGWRVALGGNVIGDDSNGRVVLRANDEQQFLLPTNTAPLPNFETPYRVLLQSPNQTPTILSRYQAAQRRDAQHDAQIATEFPNVPRAKLICCSDELPCAAARLAQMARATRTPFWLVRSGVAPSGTVGVDGNLASESCDRVLDYANFASSRSFEETDDDWRDFAARDLAAKISESLPT